MPEFVTAVAGILNDNALVGVERIDVDDALGVAIPKKYRDEHENLTRQFNEMADARPENDLVIYTHEHGKREILVQHAWYTKGTGVKELCDFLKTNKKFEKVIVVTFGNSTNDESMHKVANESGGFSVRVSEGRTCVKYRFVSVSDIQQGLIFASLRIKKDGGQAPGRNAGYTCRPGGRDSSGKSRK
jgi:hydroxymethylpyrimidine pyrophosphatase-like HAD family hydrolase